MYDMRNRLYTRLQSMSMRFFTSTRSGEILSRLNNDVAGIQDAVTNSFTTVISNAIIVVTTVVLMALPRLAPDDLRAGRAAALHHPDAHRRRHAAAAADARRRSRLGDMNSQMQETLSVNGALLTKIFGRQTYEYARFDETNRDVRDLTFRRLMTGRWFFMLLGLFGGLAPALVYWYGGHQVIAGNLTAGEVVAFAALVTRIFTPVTQLLSVWITVQSSLALFERVFDYGDMTPEIADAPEARRRSRDVAGRVTYDHVSFQYARHAPALSDISFEVAPGQMAAFVGMSGAGKTTLTYLLPRLYDVTTGRVLIDGHDVRDVTLASLSGAIGMVTQEPYLFHASIRENIRYARPDATRRARCATPRARRTSTTSSQGLPRGYDTIVGERGYRLSGGEKQRVAIARAVLKNPPILILDEATSSLDSQSERVIQLALDELARGRTTLVIAHRLSTDHAGGRDLRRGGAGASSSAARTAELLARNGAYANLYHHQFGAATPLLAAPMGHTPSYGTIRGPNPPSVGNAARPPEPFPGA